ncbi:MAG: hypothetical protein WC867_04980 [Candidatus Pacearchaeota archaeon]|jgi:hypothetical protein
MIKYSRQEDREKQIEFFSIPEYFILTPELTIKLESFSEADKNWHFLADFVDNYITSSRKAYINNLLEASLFYSINSIEFALKAKYCLYLYENNKVEEAEEYLINRNSTFGELLSDNNRLQNLDIYDLKEDLLALKDFRDGLFHFNYEKIKEGIKRFGLDFSFLEGDNTFIYYTAFIDDDLVLNIYNKCLEILKRLFVKK